MADMMIIRSKLFVPGDRPELFEKASASAADALSFDLEDAVEERKKTAARAHVASFLRRANSASEKIYIVRVNPWASSHFDRDLDAIVGPGLHLVNIPKVESAHEVSEAAETILSLAQKRKVQNQIPLLVNIETPKALRLAAEIANASPLVVGLQVGFNNLLTRFTIDSSDATAQQFVRLQVRLAAAERNLFALDGAFSEFKNPNGFHAEALRARAMGFQGKSCLHPNQVPIANDVFTPTAEEVAFAQEVVRAAPDTGGVAVVKNQMVDAPMIAHAQSIIALAKKLEICRS
jgi:citrate lyase subunit beta/citryl-CoA lyase